MIALAFVAIASLFLTVALLPVPGGVVFAPFTFGLFLLALVGVLAGREDREARGAEARRDERRPEREAERAYDLAA